MILEIANNANSPVTVRIIIKISVYIFTKVNEDIVLQDIDT